MKKNAILIASSAFLLFIIVGAFRSSSPKGLNFLNCPPSWSRGDLKTSDNEVCKPSWSYPLGTTTEGKDLWAVLSFAVLRSLAMAAMAAVFAALFGVLAAGLFIFSKNIIAPKVLRLLQDGLLMIPPLLGYVLVISLLEPQSILQLSISLAIFAWMTISRFCEPEFERMKRQSWFLSLRTEKASLLTLILEAFPHILPTIFAAILTLLPGLLLAEATLHYLGGAGVGMNDTLGFLIKTYANSVFNTPEVGYHTLVLSTITFSFMLFLSFLISEKVAASVDPYRRKDG